MNPATARAGHIDVHAHLDKYVDEDLDLVIEEIERDGIATMAVSVGPESYERTRTIARRCSLIVPSFGIHPWQAPRHRDALDTLQHQCSSSPMIGEIGLDHRFVDDTTSQRAQAIVLANLLDLAVEQRKVVNIHSAGAEHEVAVMLHARRIERVIMHWYAGPADLLRTLSRRGYYFSVGPAVLRTRHICELASQIPDDLLLTETDNPGAQHWLTGRSGRPDLIAHVEDRLAQVRGTTPVHLRRLVAENLARLVGGDLRLAPWSSIAALLDHSSGSDLR